MLQIEFVLTRSVCFNPMFVLEKWMYSSWVVVVEGPPLKPGVPSALWLKSCSYQVATASPPGKKSEVMSKGTISCI